MDKDAELCIPYRLAVNVLERLDAIKSAAPDHTIAGANGGSDTIWTRVNENGWALTASVPNFTDETTLVPVSEYGDIAAQLGIGPKEFYEALNTCLADSKPKKKKK